MKALSMIALLVALAVVFMLQEKTVKTTVIDQQTGQNRVHQIEQDIKAQLQKGVERLEDIETHPTE